MCRGNWDFIQIPNKHCSVREDMIKNKNTLLAGLYCNKALALMFAVQDSEAKACIDQSLSLDQNNQLTRCIFHILQDVASGKISRPKLMKEILKVYSVGLPCETGGDCT